MTSPVRGSLLIGSRVPNSFLPWMSGSSLTLCQRLNEPAARYLANTCHRMAKRCRLKDGDDVFECNTWAHTHTPAWWRLPRLGPAVGSASKGGFGDLWSGPSKSVTDLYGATRRDLKPHSLLPCSLLQDRMQKTNKSKSEKGRACLTLRRTRARPRVKRGRNRKLLPRLRALILYKPSVI